MTNQPSILGPEIGLVADDHPFRRQFRKWLTDHVPTEPEPREQDARVAFRREWQRVMHRDGWAGPAWPEEYGGRGLGPVEHFMYYEELALARAPEIANHPGVTLLGPTLMRHGPDELKQRFLPGILSGDDMWCQGFSEPDAGSDLAALRTRALREGDEWVVYGQKIWTTWAQYADWCAVLCRTDQEAKRHRGISLLVVPMDQSGITTRPIVQMSGGREFSEVFLDAARTAADLIVGGEKGGWKAAMTMFEYERADIGFANHARQLVLINDAAELLDKAELTRPEREQARLQLARLWARGQQLRRLNLRAAADAARGKPIGVGGSTIKLFWSALEQEIAAFGASLVGVDGLSTEHTWGEYVLASRAASIYSGTNEIQRNIVAERMLGLPR